eukprot:TRINITY_DN3096_c0_g1_i4.p1 TRINITY_DN3096_c0_g1~~TRINITY_DN3096_c0_g1_i4.p1  ORF type:complete len:603 (+),score=112.24 TRINITY_DN3096_c0_g1_i4:108-1916(+)
MIRRPPRSTQGVSSAASDVYKRQVVSTQSTWVIVAGKNDSSAKDAAEWIVSGEVSAGVYEKTYSIGGRTVTIKAIPCAGGVSTAKDIGDCVVALCREPTDLPAMEKLLGSYMKVPIKFILYDGCISQSSYEMNWGAIGMAKTTPEDLVESIIKENNELVKLIASVFNEFDKDKSGYIELKEIKEVAKELGTEIPESEAEEIIQELDINKDGKISMEEFVEFWKTGRQGRSSKMGGIVGDFLKAHPSLAEAAQALSAFSYSPTEESALKSSSFSIRVNKVYSAGLQLNVSFMTKGKEMESYYNAFSEAIALDPTEPFVGISFGCKNPSSAHETLQSLVETGTTMAQSVIPEAEKILSFVNQKFGHSSNKAVMCITASEASKGIISSIMDQLPSSLGVLLANQFAELNIAFSTDLQKLITEDMPFYELLLQGLSIDFKGHSSEKFSENLGVLIKGINLGKFLPPPLAPLAGSLSTFDNIFGESHGELEFEVDNELMEMIKGMDEDNQANIPLKDQKPLLTTMAAGMLEAIPMAEMAHSFFKDEVNSIEFFFYFAGLAAFRVYIALPGLGDFISLDQPFTIIKDCLLYTSPSPRDLSTSRMPSSA